MPKDGSSLCVGFNSNYSMKIRQYVLFKIKTLPTRKLHRERNHSFYSENVWGSIEVRGLRFASSVMGTQNLLFVLRSWQDEKTSFSISLLSSKLTISYSIWKLFIFYITGIFGGCMLKILGGHFVSTSSTARKTIETILMKLLRYRNDSNNWFRVD